MAEQMLSWALTMMSSPTQQDGLSCLGKAQECHCQSAKEGTEQVQQSWAWSEYEGQIQATSHKSGLGGDLPSPLNMVCWQILLALMAIVCDSSLSFLTGRNEHDAGVPTLAQKGS